MQVRKYKASPTGARFHKSKKFVRYIAGPVGSGKSVACDMELLMRAMRQEPDEDGKRRTRWAIIRNTYPELHSTTIKTFQDWIPDDVAPLVKTTPAVATLKQRLPDGTRVEAEFVFLALDSPDDASKLLSLELTGCYINEAREIPWEIMEALISRIPRYPATKKDENGKRLFGPTEPGIIMDSNPPRTTHWLYEKFETGKTPDGWEKFQQPPAVYWDEVEETFKLNPDAENLMNLDDDYYSNQLKAAGDNYDFVRVQLACEFGMSRRGKPVFARFSEYKHVAKEVIVPHRGAPLMLGFDFGLSPACIFGQQLYQGIRIVDELVAGDESLEDFLDQLVLPLLTSKYPGFSVMAVGDPAGVGRTALDKRTPFDVLRSRGIRAFPASTNAWVPRKQAVDFYLSRDEGFKLSPHCTVSREAFGGGYVFKEVRGSNGLYADVPVKNEYSHPMDATQYLCLLARFGARQMINAMRPPPSATPGKPTHLWA